MDKNKRRSLATLDSHTKDLGDGTVEVIVSTEAVDRHGEKISMKGLDLSKYNGTVLLGHDYNGLPIGKSVYLKKTKDGKLISRTKFATDQYPLADTVYKLVRDGYMPDVSIGFIPKEYDPETDTWTKAEMIEYSHVTIGANPDAKVTGKALAEIGLKPDEFEAQIKSFEKLAKAKQAEEAEAATGADEMVIEDETVDEGDVRVTEPQPGAPAPDVTPGGVNDNTPVDEPKPSGDAADTEDGSSQTKQLKAILKTLEETLPEAKALIAKLEGTGASGLTPKKRKLVLVNAKSTGRKLDKLAEAFIAASKKSN